LYRLFSVPRPTVATRVILEWTGYQYFPFVRETADVGEVLLLQLLELWFWQIKCIRRTNEEHTDEGIELSGRTGMGRG
jgi:hypothetical protein